MLGIYPHTTALILDDDIYAQYGGDRTKGQDPQRNAAFVVAEKRVSAYLKTFLLPTIVTGTFPWPYLGQPYQLPYTHIQQVLSVTVLSHDGDCSSCTLTEDDGCSFVRDGIYGLIHVRRTSYSSLVCCTCHSTISYPYQMRVALEAGLPTGTATQPDVLLALSTVADIVLNEIVDPSGNESPGDIGVQRWGAQGYSEERVTLRRTALGTSARASFAADLLDAAVPHRRAGRLGM